VQGNASPRILPFAAYMLFIALADLLPAGGLTDWRWLYAVKVAAVAALLWAYRRHYVELARFDLTARVAAVAVAVGLLVFALWISLDASWMQIGVPAGFDPRSADSGAIEWPLALARIAGAALVVPVMEELFWRSFVLRWLHQADFLTLDPARVGVKALAISVLLFGIEPN
jgi:CAAX prenyl protease-like protein